MKKAILFLIVLLLSTALFSAAIGTSGTIKAYLDVSTSNAATVGFSSGDVTSWDTTTPKADVKLDIDTTDGTAENTEDTLWVYAKIQSGTPCDVKLSVPGAMRGYADSTAAGSGPWDTSDGGNLGWEIGISEGGEPFTTIIDVAENDSGDLDEIIFEHTGMPATKIYSKQLKITTDDYRSKEANYFVQNIKVEVIADSQTNN